MSHGQDGDMFFELQRFQSRVDGTNPYIHVFKHGDPHKAPLGDCHQLLSIHYI